MNLAFPRIKPYLNGAIGLGVLFFLGKALSQNWKAVLAVQLESINWFYLGIGLAFTLLAYVVAGLIWSWLLQAFKHPLNNRWLIGIHLKTNLTKYLPGSIWHYYGRISQITEADVPLKIASISVFVEPFILSASALFVIIITHCFAQVKSQNIGSLTFQILCLLGLLLSLHPRILNPVLQRLGRLKMQEFNAQTIEAIGLRVERYPLLPVLGGMGYVGLRSMGFLSVFIALTPVSLDQLPLLLNAFNLAWLASFILPISPGGIGVFEASIIALLDTCFSTGVMISTVALYRLIVTLAEILGAGLASLVDWKEKNQARSQQTSSF